MPAATIFLMQQGLTLTAKPDQQFQFVAPAELYEWSAPRDRSFALAVRRLFLDGAIGYQDYLSMTAAYRKK